MKRLALLFILLICLMLPSQQVGSTGTGPLVVATISPLASIVQEAFPNVRVLYLIPPSADPHEYQLTVEQVSLLKEASVIVTTGGHLPIEARIKELSEEGQLRGRALFVNDYKREGFRYLQETWYGGKENPHGVWLDPANAIAIAGATERALEDVDPTNAASYREDFEAFKEKVETIEEALRDSVPGNSTAVIDMPPVQYATAWLGVRPIAAIKPEEEVPALPVDELVGKAMESNLIVYNLQGSSQLRNAASELASKSGRPLAGVVVFWGNETYTKVLLENSISIIKALSGGGKIVKVEAGKSPLPYAISALFAGLSLGMALGYILRR